MPSQNNANVTIAFDKNGQIVQNQNCNIFSNKQEIENINDHMKMIKEKMANDKRELRRKHFFSLLVIVLNILFDYGSYSLIQNSETALVICVFVNSWSMRWVYRNYDFSVYPILDTYLWGTIYTFIIISCLMIITLICSSCQQFIFSNFQFLLAFIFIIIFLLSIFFPYKF